MGKKLDNENSIKCCIFFQVLLKHILLKVNSILSIFLQKVKWNIPLKNMKIYSAIRRSFER